MYCVFSVDRSVVSCVRVAVCVVRRAFGAGFSVTVSTCGLAKVSIVHRAQSPKRKKDCEISVACVYYCDLFQAAHLHETRESAWPASVA